MNLSNLLFLNPNVFNELLRGNSIGSTDPDNPYFSDIINNSPYFRERFGDNSLYIYCFDFLTKQNIINNIDSKILFHELFTNFNGNQTKSLFFPNLDYNVSTINYEICNNYINNYEYRKNKSFIIAYNFNEGQKIALSNLVTISGKTYLIGNGFNLMDVIDNAIISKGDNLITGNFSIIDSNTNNPVLNVDTNKNEAYTLYKFGIGTINPKSVLDIKASGLDAIINSISELSIIMNNLNNNLSLLINADSDKDFKRIIETEFKNYNVFDSNGNPTPYIQTKDNYFLFPKYLIH